MKSLFLRNTFLNLNFFSVVFRAVLPFDAECFTDETFEDFEAGDLRIDAEFFRFVVA